MRSVLVSAWRRLGAAALAGWVAFGLGASASAATAPVQPLPIEQFTKWPAISSVVISPSGQRLALLMHGPNGFLRLAVMDLAPVSEPRIVAGFAGADIGEVSWVSDDRLVYAAWERGAELRLGGFGWFAADHDGSDKRQLVAFHWDTGNNSSVGVNSRILPMGWGIDAAFNDGSGDVVAYQARYDEKRDFSHFELSRLNTSTGVLRHIGQGLPERVNGWLLDQNHQLKVVTTNRGDKSQVHVRSGGQKADDSDASWQQVAEFNSYGTEGFRPWLIDADGRLLVLASPQGVEGIYRFDTRAKKLLPEPLLLVKGFDLSPTPLQDPATGKLLGVQIQADRPITVWLDPKLQRMQDAVDAALPGRTNITYCGQCETSRFIVVSSSSDRAPPSYHLLDRDKGALTLLGASRPWIDPATQGTRSFQRITTRDGQSMPVYVTSPAGADPKTPLPTVVLVHGGPWVRGANLLWQAVPQFLASRGYRVIEPEFRGSEGYGGAWFRAGWKQWGQRMQDDLIDAVQWASGQGLSDAKRVCIMGGSYGGYAALMGAVHDPDAYRCAISFAGVTDPMLMYDISWSDFSDSYKRYGMPKLVGDRDKDAAMLEAASPLKRAGEIKAPLLVAYGGVDRRVPMAHSQRFISAARKAGVQVEELPYLDEGHGLFLQESETDFYQHVEAFLAGALKPASAGAQARAASAP